MEDSQAQRSSVSIALDQVRQGNADAVGEIWRRYFPRLVRVAGNTLRNLPHRRQDAEDAAQSALGSFWKKVQGPGIEQVLDSNALWRLLATITVRKARGMLRAESALKRGGGRVVPFSELGEDLPFEELLSVIPTQEFDLNCEEWLAQLDPELRQFAVLRLLGFTNREIAEQFNCTQRRIERKLNLVRRVWQNVLDQETEREPPSAGTPESDQPDTV